MDPTRSEHRVVMLHKPAREQIGLRLGKSRSSQQIARGPLPGSGSLQKIRNLPQPYRNCPFGLLSCRLLVNQLPHAVLCLHMQRTAVHIPTCHQQSCRGTHALTLQQPDGICRAHQAVTKNVRGLVVNTGIANAGTGETGLADAKATCKVLAQLLDCKAEETLVFSTGVIMEPLPMDRLLAGLPKAVDNLAPNNWIEAAQAIMTTDTVQKAFSTKALIDGKLITVTGISKGSGMIEPRMATMLGFIATDAGVAPDVLAKVAKRVADASFNRITVDGDTSTNDSFITIATGQSELSIESEDDPRLEALVGALTIVGQHLAQSMIRDGEGASKFITIQVQGARTESEALQVCYAVAHSPLVKTAFFASDPNLGRILAAVGNARVEDLDANKFNLWLFEVQVARI